MSEIEVEVRGPLSKEKYQELEELFSQDGRLKSEKDRVLIDYSEFFTKESIGDRQKDLRLRVTNKIPEIVVKLGRWGGKEQRHEIAVTTPEGSFDSLVQIFATLGADTGILCVRKGRVYVYKGIEFSLVEVPGHSYFFEAELLISKESDHQAAHEKIAAVCQELGIRLFSEQEWFDYVATLNKEANELFEYSSYKPGYFQKRFDL